MRVLFLGDISGKAGRYAVKRRLGDMREEFNIDAVIANGENCAGGLGITRPTALELFEYGVDVITLGNHTFKKHDVASFLDDEPMIIRPANYPKTDPGRGWVVAEIGEAKIGVINLQGQVFMEPINSPFEAASEIIDEIKCETNIIFVDIHAEATSEKIALGYYLDGKVTAVLGTHTHVQTADEQILPNGTAYITDVGMTGVSYSVLGLDVEMATNRFLSFVPVKFTLAEGDARVRGVIVELCRESGLAVKIERVDI